MNQKIVEIYYKRTRFRIEEDRPEVGMHSIIFEARKNMKSFLNDNIENCKNQAFKEYGVPIDNW